MKLVLDANVLENMLNTAVNQNGFITEMISQIISERRTLGLDEGLRIDKEYFSRLGQWMHKADESIARQLLGWFIGTSSVRYPHVQRQEVDQTDPLMKCIKRQMPDKPKKNRSMDRVYVYVAARLGGTLVTADQADILSVDADLKKCAKTHARKDLEILDIHSAKAWLAKQPAKNPPI
jgi:hypothetical protein